MHCSPWRFILIGWVAVGFCSAGPIVQAKPSAARIAGRVDDAIARQLFSDETELAPRTGDATFLRRVWLDLVGDIPAPEEVIAFSIDPASDRRQRIVRQLLDDPQFGQNWARYWRDVVFYRRLEDRAIISSGAMVADLAERFNNDIGWNRIATEFITASGDVQEVGATAIMMAQGGLIEQTTAEVARIFLGISIQCAQCHDHPSDRWKREQFHELAAFFPRTGLRQVRTATRRSFEVYVNNRKARRRRPNNSNRPQTEHFMPDLEKPTALGKRMAPKFFLTGASLPTGKSDAERRGQLAEWLTDNRWFATAMVNRMWAELVGEGFYESVEDIGPDREAIVPAAVELLSEKFRESGYDLKWLLETICLTEAYQRQSRPPRGSGETPFTANVPYRLRGDQLFNSVLSVLEVDESSDRQARRAARRGGPARMVFNGVFGYDPSVARNDITASIPQSLALMNGKRINGALSEKNQRNMLGRLLREVEDDEQIVVELYLRCFCREPSPVELARALDYRNEVGRQLVAYEDLLWALVNSAEFQHRR